MAVGLDVTFDMFFDRQKVINSIDRKSRQVLTRSGAFGRRVMRNKIRKAPKRKRRKDDTRERDERGRFVKKGSGVRPAAILPRYHGSSNSGIRLILFGYDPRRQRTVIGPLKFNAKPPRASKRGRTIVTKPIGKTVPELLNEGGQAQQIDEQINGRRETRRINYRKHPYRDVSMQPTMEFFARQMATLPF